MWPRLDPKLDVVFKMLFAREQNRALLVSLLTAVLRPPSPITVVQVLNPELPREGVIEKGVVLDLHVELADGRRVDVEMQTGREAAFSDRALLYLSRLFAGSLRAGQGYGELPRCVSILILDYVELQTPRFHCTFHMSEDRSQERFSDALELHTVELPKLPAWPPQAGDEEASLIAWGAFLAARSDQEVEEVAMKNPDISQAKVALEELSADPAARWLAEARLLGARALEAEFAAQRREGREEGRQKGREEGREQGREEGRREGLRAGIELLVQVQGLEWTEPRRRAVGAMSVEELQALQAELVRTRRWPEQ